MWAHAVPSSCLSTPTPAPLFPAVYWEHTACLQKVLPLPLQPCWSLKCFPILGACGLQDLSCTLVSGLTAYLLPRGFSLYFLDSLSSRRLWAWVFSLSSKHLCLFYWGNFCFISCWMLDMCFPDFSYSFNKHFLSASCVLSSILGPGDTAWTT